MATASARAGARQAARLSVPDWIEAGFALIAEEGLRAVKIDRLCRRLGVTKGSFYWHFSDIQGYMDALAAAWAADQKHSRASFEALRELPPAERLSAMMKHLTSPRQWTLERAVREWARWDPAVAAEVRSADRVIFRAVRRAFLDAGFPAAEARVRARACFAAGVGFIHLADHATGAADAREHERFLEIMLSADPSPGRA